MRTRLVMPGCGNEGPKKGVNSNSSNPKGKFLLGNGELITVAVVAVESGEFARYDGSIKRTGP